MARGFDSVKEAGKDIQARKEASSESFPDRVYFKIKSGETATVRFLEQGSDVNWAWVHDLVVPGKDYPIKVVCRDQDEEGRRIGESCPGCEQDLKRSFRGVVNVIWRGAGDSGEDIVAMWIAGPRVFVETLDPLESAYRGLSSRDFTVTRRGERLDTQYSILPADPDGGAKELTASDKKLAKDKFDLSYFVEAPSYDEWGKSKNKSSGESKEFTPVSDASPFRRPAA